MPRYLRSRGAAVVGITGPPGVGKSQIVAQVAARHGVQLPVVDTTLEQYARLVEAGHGDDDISSLFVLKDALFRG